MIISSGMTQTLRSETLPCLLKCLYHNPHDWHVFFKMHAAPKPLDPFLSKADF